MNEQEGPIAVACPSCRCLVIWEDRTGMCIHCEKPLKDEDGNYLLIRLKPDRPRAMAMTED